MNRWNRQAAESYRRAIAGYEMFPGRRTKAVLKIDRRAGLDYGGWREGERISESTALAAVVKRRADPVAR